MFSREDFKGRVAFNGTRTLRIMETVRQRAPTLQGTFQDRMFPHEERPHMVLTLEPYARFQELRLGAFAASEPTGGPRERAVIQKIEA